MLHAQPNVVNILTTDFINFSVIDTLWMENMKNFPNVFHEDQLNCNWIIKHKDNPSGWIHVLVVFTATVCDWNKSDYCKFINKFRKNFGTSNCAGRCFDDTRRAQLSEQLAIFERDRKSNTEFELQIAISGN